ncbi:hypothetical protein [Deinococcus peraridilitoris]|uniref:hypothetical protein n=1 Tax=Deinococcus peraridilitoris TaxID=432329 RepID=UPI0002EB7CE9|nr:hypothetical protein [Deinococcus peraridilitoris]
MSLDLGGLEKFVQPSAWGAVLLLIGTLAKVYGKRIDVNLQASVNAQGQQAQVMQTVLTELEQARKEIRDLNAKVGELLREVGSLSGKVVALEHSESILLRDNNRLTRENEELDDENRLQAARISELESQLRACQEEA